MARDVPPWPAVCQQTWRWLKAGVFEDMARDLPAGSGKAAYPSAAWLLPCRWAVEGSFAWMACFRRLACDYARLTETLVGPHFVAFGRLMAHRFATFLVQSARQALEEIERAISPLLDLPEEFGLARAGPRLI